MKFTITQNFIIEPLCAVSQFTQKNITLPILGCIRLDVGDGLLILTATDLERQRQDTIACPDHQGDGAVLVPAHQLKRLVAGFGAFDDIMFEKSGSSLIVTCLGSTHRIPCHGDVGDFPDLKQVGDEHVAFELESDQVDIVFATPLPDVSDQETRYYLKGVFLDQQDGKLRGVSTDGHCATISDSSAEVEPFTGIVPTKLVRNIISLTECYDSIRFKVCENYIEASVDDGAIIVRGKLIDGTFPDYRSIVPDAEARKKYTAVEMPAVETMRALDRLIAVSGEDPLRVKFKFDKIKHEITLTLHSAKVAGDYSETIDGVFYAGAAPSVEFYANSGLLLRAIRPVAVNDTTFYLHFPPDSLGAPLIVTADEQPGVTRLVMPMSGA